MHPQVTVKDSPAAWWQHAGYAALQECRLISRRQFPFSGMARRRTSRQLYQVRLVKASERRLDHIGSHCNADTKIRCQSIVRLVACSLLLRLAYKKLMIMK